MLTPAHPRHAGSISDTEGGASLFGPSALSVSGNYAYVINFVSNSLEIVNITNPLSPVHAGTVSDGERGVTINDPSSIYVSGSMAYVSNSGSNSIEIINVSRSHLSSA